MTSGIKRQRQQTMSGVATCWRQSAALVLLLLAAMTLLVQGKSIKNDDDVQRPAMDLNKVVSLVCANKKAPIQSVRQMLRVISEVQRDDQKCGDRYQSAVYELQPILQTPSAKLCSDAAFDMLKDYHFRFIQPMKHANRRPTQFEPLPRDIVKEQLHPEPRRYTVDFDEHNQVLFAPLAIRHFFLKFALQVSYQCKKNLINNLEADAKRVLDDKDREVMTLFSKDSPIGQALSTGGGFENINFDSALYMPELDGRLVTKDGDAVTTAEDREQHLKTNAQENSALFQMIYTCKNRFKPLYDKLIVPIVRLSKLGYDYQGERGFTERERDYLAGPQMKDWLVLAHVCEIFKNTVLIQTTDSPSVAAAAADKGHQSLREQLNAAERDDDDESHASDDNADDDDDSNEEGELEVVSEQEAKELALRARLEDKFKAIEYEPTVLNEMTDELMIERERDLDRELSRKHGGSPFGLRGFIRRRLAGLKRQLAKLDLMKFAHYRRHSLWYSGLLNFISSLSNVASISITVMCLGGFTFAGR